VPDETVKTVGFQAVIGLQRDEDAEAMAKLKDGGDADESTDGGDDQPQVADSVAVDRPTVETIQMRWQPGERDCDDNQGNENPTAGRIFAPADSQAAASGKGVSDRAGQGQNDKADTRRIGKESCPIAPTPNREREKRQRAADSKREVLKCVIQKEKETETIADYGKIEEGGLFQMPSVSKHCATAACGATMTFELFH
jgi:hypothetical protein